MSEAAPRPVGAEVPGAVAQAVVNIAYNREVLPDRLDSSGIEVVKATLTSLVQPGGPSHLLGDPEAAFRDARLETYAETEPDMMTVLRHAAAVRGFKLVRDEEGGS